MSDPKEGEVVGDVVDYFWLHQLHIMHLAATG